MRLLLIATILAVLALPAAPVFAQNGAQTDRPGTEDAETEGQAEIRPPSVTIPNYWDPRRRPEKPAAGAVRAIRFMTEPDYPPFSFAAGDGSLIGFNVDLARALCEELAVPCTIQARDWETLIPALEEERGDAIVASLALSPDMRRRVALTDRYLANPARFVVPAGSELGEATAEILRGRRIASVEGTAHTAYLEAFFPRSEILAVDSAEARRLVREGEVDALFGDGIGLSFWLNGASSEECCRFAGGPFVENRFFGEGMAIGVRPNEDGLRRALNYALARLHETGVYQEIYLKYFPVSFY